MRTVGQILKEEREAKFYTLDEIEKATKIRKELLKALEEDNYQKLPPPTFVQGFIKNYGKFLGLDTEKLLAIFRREFSDRKNPPKIMEAWKSPWEEARFRLTPTKFISALVVILIISFFAYLWFEYRFLVGAPFLEVIQPPDQTNIAEEVILVKGKTDPEVKVDINNQEVSVDQDGNFSQELKLTESATMISIIATSKSGKSTKIERTIFLKKVTN
jgi:cytoskeletal protein RodZ